MNNDNIENIPVDKTNNHYLNTQELIKRNQLEKALQEINRALEADNESLLFLETKGKVLTMLGDFNQAESLLKKALQLNPNQYLPNIILGQIYYAQGKKKAARQQFTKATITGSEFCDAEVSLAKILIDEGEIEKAVEKLNLLRKTHPEDQTLQLTLGQAYLELGEYYLAEELYQTMIKIFPENDLSKLYLGVTKIYLGDINQAQELIEKYNYYYPNKREGLAGLGLLLIELNQHEEAKVYLKEAIGKGNAPMLWKSSYVECLVNLGKIKPAIKFYKKLKKEFDNKYATFRLGALYESQKKLNKAKKNYKRITPKDFNYFSAFQGLIRCLFAQKSFEDAEKECNKALETFPQDIEITDMLLPCLLSQNKEAQALLILEKIRATGKSKFYEDRFRQIEGLIFDKQEEYKSAMELFLNKENGDKKTNTLLSEEDLLLVSGFKAEKKNKQEPLFIMGNNCSLVRLFIGWLKENKIDVLTDHLSANTREDMFNKPTNIQNLSEEDSDLAGFRRKKYLKKAKRETRGEKVIEGLYFSPTNIAIIKKHFPTAKVVLLTRDTTDIWLHQKVFGNNNIDSTRWNEAINQVISMNVNLEQIHIDQWLEGESAVTEKLEQVFSTKLKPYKTIKHEYWKQQYFKQGHWKNYKAFLGQ